MKKHKLMTLLSILLLCLVCFAGTASASLIDLGAGVIYDDVNNQYWIQDLAMFNSMTYSEQISAIDELSESEGYGSYGEWRMATADDMGKLLTYNIEDMYTVFEAALTGERGNNGEYGTQESYRARYDEETGSGHGQLYMIVQYDTSGAYEWSTRYYNSITDSAYGSNVGAWVVVDAAPVPVPSALVLLGAGLTLLAGTSRKKR